MAKSNQFAKGNTASRGKGRPKGSKDKSTMKAREMIAGFIDELEAMEG